MFSLGDDVVLSSIRIQARLRLDWCNYGPAGEQGGAAIELKQGTKQVRVRPSFGVYNIYMISLSWGAG